MTRINAVAVAVGFIAGIAVGLGAAAVTAEPHREFNPQHRHFAPTQAPGSGLQLPLDGE